MILHFLEQSHEEKKISKLETLVLSSTSSCLTLRSLIKTVASIVFNRFKPKLTLSVKHTITSGSFPDLVKSKSKLLFPHLWWIKLHVFLMKVRSFIWLLFMFLQSHCELVSWFVLSKLKWYGLRCHLHQEPLDLC